MYFMIKGIEETILIRLLKDVIWGDGAWVKIVLALEAWRPEFRTLTAI